MKPASRVPITSSGGGGGGKIEFFDDAGDERELITTISIPGFEKVSDLPDFKDEIRAIRKEVKALTYRSSREDRVVGRAYARKCHTLSWLSASGKEIPAPHWPFDGRRSTRLSDANVDALVEASLYSKGYSSWKAVNDQGERDGVLLDAISLYSWIYDYRADLDKNGRLGDLFFLPRNGIYCGDCDDLAKDAILFADSLRWHPLYRELYSRWELTSGNCSAFTDGHPLNHVTVFCISKDKCGVIECTGATEALPTLTSPEADERRRRFAGSGRYPWLKSDDPPPFFRVVTQLWKREGPSATLVIDDLGGGVPFLDFCAKKYREIPLYTPGAESTRKAELLLSYEPPSAKITSVSFSPGPRWKGKEGTANCKMGGGGRGGKLTFVIGGMVIKSAGIEIY